MIGNWTCDESNQECSLCNEEAQLCLCSTLTLGLLSYINTGITDTVGSQSVDVHSRFCMADFPKKICCQMYATNRPINGNCYSEIGSDTE